MDAGFGTQGLAIYAGGLPPGADQMLICEQSFGMVQLGQK
jgi:hypothetical protein